MTSSTTTMNGSHGEGDAHNTHTRTWPTAQRRWTIATHARTTHKPWRTVPTNSDVDGERQLQWCISFVVFFFVWHLFFMFGAFFLFLFDTLFIFDTHFCFLTPLDYYMNSWNFLIFLVYFNSIHCFFNLNEFIWCWYLVIYNYIYVYILFFVRHFFATSSTIFLWQIFTFRYKSPSAINNIGTK